MKKVIIYGGSFNPLHNGHEAIIAHCLSLASFSELWIMPSAKRADKPDLLADELRLEMLDAYVAASDFDSNRLKVSDFEIQLGMPSETIRTYQALVAAFADTEFTFVFGTDSLADMPKWRGGVYLEEVMNIIAVERVGLAFACDPLKHLCAYIPEHVSGLSSTTIRQNIRRGIQIADKVPASVEGFIFEHRLYIA